MKVKYYIIQTIILILVIEIICNINKKKKKLISNKIYEGVSAGNFLLGKEDIKIIQPKFGHYKIVNNYEKVSKWSNSSYFNKNVLCDQSFTSKNMEGHDYDNNKKLELFEDLLNKTNELIKNKLEEQRNFPEWLKDDKNRTMPHSRTKRRFLDFPPGSYIEVIEIILE